MMQAEIFDGRSFANQILAELAATIQLLKKKPVLAIILVGDNNASMAYIKQKKNSAEKIGADIAFFHFQDNITANALSGAIADIQNGRVGDWQKFLIDGLPKQITKPDGIVIQRPLPKHFNSQALVNLVDPNRDIDGFNPKSPFLPPVGIAVVKIMAAMTNLQAKDISQKYSIVLVGSGETAGAPIAKTLEAMSIRYTNINHTTKNPLVITKNADILVTAIGKANTVTSDWVKPGACVIDVGINRIKDQDGIKLHGDCDDSVRRSAKIMTPVPGGVGPVNVACLMQNLVTCARQQ